LGNIGKAYVEGWIDLEGDLATILSIADHLVEPQNTTNHLPDYSVILSTSPGLTAGTSLIIMTFPMIFMPCGSMAIWYILALTSNIQMTIWIRHKYKNSTIFAENCSYSQGNVSWILAVVGVL